MSDVSSDLDEATAWLDDLDRMWVDEARIRATYGTRAAYEIARAEAFVAWIILNDKGSSANEIASARASLQRQAEQVG